MPRTPALLRCLPLVAALALWAILCWPLPARFGAAIPWTAHRGERPAEMLAPVPGDHLQLLYHFWLTRDMLAGNTPPLHNLYEFNTGDDAARRRFDPGYLPLSLIYAVLSPFFGHAFGWNAAQLAALLLAFLALHALARRYAPPAATVPTALAALVAFAAPYQWVNVGSGSPTAFGMAWVPALALGLDIAVRDRRPGGGVLAGAALLSAYLSDLHCFFFSALLLPVWCIFARLASRERFWPDRTAVLTLARALAPTILAGIVALAIAVHLQAQYAVTDVAEGRTLCEVRANSPSRRSLFGWILHGHDLHFQLGLALPFTIFVAGVAALRRAWRPTAPPSLRWRALVMLGIGLALVVLLALGTRAPFDGLPLRVLRFCLPPYRKIRQPIKIFCLLPTLLAPLLAAGFAALWQASRPALPRPRLRHVAVVLLTLAVVADARRMLRFGIGRLRPEAGAAYAAVVRDAADRGVRPHVLALPLWPGDAAWTSLCQYEAMLTRIRFVNGYAPVRTEDYLENVFRRFESVTQGRLTAAQAGGLRAMGVTALVLHADFPETVSPFPVTATWRRLRRNPWLQALACGDGAWAFALRASPAERNDAENAQGPHWFSPARRWHWPAPAPGDPAASSVRAAFRSPAADWPDARWLVRVRGDGRLRLERAFREARGANGAVTSDEVALDGARFHARHTGGPPAPTATLKMHADTATGSYRWLAVPFGNLPYDGWATPELRATTLEGPVAVLDILFAAGPDFAAGDVFALPAADLFRSGETRMQGGSPAGVRFRPGYDPPEVVLHGPHLPLPAGRWQVTVKGEFEDGPAGTLHVALGAREVARTPLPAADPVAFVVDDLAPLVLRFHYAGQTTVDLETLVVARAPEPPGGEAQP